MAHSFTLSIQEVEVGGSLSVPGQLGLHNQILYFIQTDKQTNQQGLLIEGELCMWRYDMSSLRLYHGSSFCFLSYHFVNNIVDSALRACPYLPQLQVLSFRLAPAKAGDSLLINSSVAETRNLLWYCGTGSDFVSHFLSSSGDRLCVL